jgi:pimeloyl-ACP methyl ester carboxylesterase
LEYGLILPTLARETTTCAYDRAGMGFSDPADDQRSAQAMVNDLAAGLHAASLQGPVLLVASSLGGIVAELFARQHPAETAGLVTLDALTSEAAEDPVVVSLGMRACAARWAAEVGLLRLVDPFGLAQSEPLAFELTYRAPTWRAICASMRALAVESVAELRKAPPLRADLPLTVIVHDVPRDLVPGASAEDVRTADSRWIAAQRAFAERSSRGRWVVAKGSGHLIASDRPDVAIDEVKRMLRDLRAAPH